MSSEQPAAAVNENSAEPGLGQALDAPEEMRGSFCCSPHAFRFWDPAESASDVSVFVERESKQKWNAER